MPTLSPAGFPYDPFQAEAIAQIDRGESLFVAAPTGSGKTAIAEYAIDHTLRSGRQAIYTAPVKALSNQKYRDFRARYGEAAIGLLTGDVAINARAPVVIMTTEIYRNTLLENPSRLASCAWAIFDEVHYLDDEERGTVWEEALLFTPPEVKLLCLSATIPNVRELAAWIRRIHDRPIQTIEEQRRPVPLHTFFQCQGLVLDTLQTLRARGYHHVDDWRTRHRRRGEVRPDADVHPNRTESLIHHIQQAEHLPCLFFTFGRRRAEELAAEMTRLPLLSPGDREQLLALFDRLCERYQIAHERSAADLRHLISHGVAYHHAGMLPTLKEVVEQLFSSRLIKLIFTTETFALGINMPARSVVLDTLRKRTAFRFRTLRCRDFFQMAGRAGRRGMDEAGFVYIRVNPMETPWHDVHHVLTGTPEPVRSRFNTAYATLLNLYRQHRRGLLAVYPRTLHHFQSSKHDQREAYQLLERKLGLLGSLGYLTKDGLTHKGEFASCMYGYELVLAELFEDGVLDGLDEVTLSVLLTALVYEPRPGLPEPTLTKPVRALALTCRQYVATIQKQERRARIFPGTRGIHFHLARAMEAWVRQTPFDKVAAASQVDEGELVRAFRMVIQLLRQIEEAPLVPPHLKAVALTARGKINRDVVDAEQQLRRGT